MATDVARGKCVAPCGIHLHSRAVVASMPDIQVFDPTASDYAWPDFWRSTAPPPLFGRSSIDVLITTFNRCPSSRTQEIPLAWALDSISRQRNSRIDRIVVVDDGSTDHTDEVLQRFQRRFGNRLVIVGDGKQRGSSAARNLGLLHCTADLVFVCDDDCQLTDHALYGLHRTYSLQKKVDPKCAAIHLAFYQRDIRPGKLVPQRRMGFVDVRKGIHYTQLKCFPLEYVGHPSWLDPESGLLAPFRINHLCGVFVAERQALVDCGGFPEEFVWPNAFCEELELSFRLLESGRTLYHQPDPKFFALHYKFGWNDPCEPRKIHAADEYRCFETVNLVISRIAISDRPALESGNRVDMETWCYSKLISYFVCLGIRSPKGAFRWMSRSHRTFVRDNASEFYGNSGKRILRPERRASLWELAFRDGLRFLSDARERSARHVPSDRQIATSH